jgi:beta-N-acetylglucosaminidase
MSYTFETYEYGIDLVAKMLTKYYINAPGTAIFDNQEAVGSYYNGSTIEAVNIRYASDTEWHTKVFNIMKSLYSKIAP